MTDHPVVRFEIGCRDLAATERFYADTFGWSFTDANEHARDIAAGTTGGPEGALTALGHEPHEYVTVYVKVPDVAEALARAETHGASALVGPTPDGKGGTFAWLRDPAGNLLGLSTPAETAPTPATPGSIGWLDLTVEDAPALRDFYTAVTGWTPHAVSMDDSTEDSPGTYEDWALLAADGTPTAGVCHARGGNADLPPVWLPYVIVLDLDASLEKVAELGGRLRSGPKPMGGARYAVIEDPAGACIALYQEG